MIRLRKKNPLLVYGQYHLLDKDHQQVYAYTRSLADEKFLVILNFSKDNLDYRIPGQFSHDEEILISNYKECKQQNDKLRLMPYQAIVMKARSG